MARKTPNIDRRQAIIDAAVHCFNKDGVVGTTFSQIAKVAKVDQPLISYYFPNFEALFAEVVNVMLEDLKNLSLEVIDENAKDPKEALLKYCQITMLWTKTRPQFNPLWTFFYYLASYEPKFRALNNNIRRGGRERISLLLYRYQEFTKLKLHPDWTIDRLAYAIHAQITGAPIMIVTETTDIPMAVDVCEKAVEALLNCAFVE